MHARSCINSECIRKEPIQKAAALLPSAEYEGHSKVAPPLLPPRRLPSLSCTSTGAAVCGRSALQVDQHRQGLASTLVRHPRRRPRLLQDPPPLQDHSDPYCLRASQGQPIDPLLICFDVFFSRSHRNLTPGFRCSSLHALTWNISVPYNFE
jgi:hypothetical protein